ncbi:MAG TPA: flagellar assembly protein FliW [Candidatus Krumholzibacteria bacterium]|nr:flagellar assembly protein FliW [Candidatus Krumholzibacteria bacterium]HPD71653.1 flagellar assembly protein FliW [Candidatus Krumholzibacteria bacterium]HRY41414.1 flagellar assembly protein FliW [Candidatus Krumholzibacteria bacterium]
MASFATVRFGILEYDAADVIELPDGLIGLPKLRRWLLLDLEPNVPMRWLQSLDRPDFGLPVMPPVFFADEYEIRASSSARRQLSAQADPQLVTLIIATVHPGGQRITGNLRAPLLVDTVTRRGAQLSLDDDGLSTRQEIDYFKFGLAVAGNSIENEEMEAVGAAAERTSLSVATGL